MIRFVKGGYAVANCRPRSWGLQWKQAATMLPELADASGPEHETNTHVTTSAIGARVRATSFLKLYM